MAYQQRVERMMKKPEFDDLRPVFVNADLIAACIAVHRPDIDRQCVFPMKVLQPRRGSGTFGLERTVNNKPIEQAVNADLRGPWTALLRAAQRARAVAAQTGTDLIVSRNGVIERIRPDAMK